jgi:hypothetical protein
LVRKWHILTLFLKYCSKPILNGTVGNLDVYTYTPHSDGSKNQLAHGILSLYWLNWCCSSQTYRKQRYRLHCT